MNIKNNTTVTAASLKELYVARTTANEEKLATGKKIANQEKSDAGAVALKISAHPGEPTEIAWENILSASSAITDVSKAEEMIREANRRILEQADSSVLTQANQTVALTSELLK